MISYTGSEFLPEVKVVDLIPEVIVLPKVKVVDLIPEVIVFASDISFTGSGCPYTGNDSFCHKFFLYRKWLTLYGK